MKLIFVALSISMTLDGVLTECPNINDLPVLNDAGDEFYCFWYWSGWGNSEPIKGCNEDEYSFMDDYDYDAPDKTYIAMGSIIVKAGCTLYGYEDHDYSGHLMKYHGPATFPDGCIGSECPPIPGIFAPSGFVSFQCRCDQDPIICQPEDGWVDVIQCDNTQSSTELLCSYTKTIGTTWSSSAQHSMSIDTTIEYAMHAGFFNMLGEDLGISVATGYDWTHVSSEAQSETETFKVEATVPPYTLLKIQGAEGNCKESGGNNNVKTELFKSITIDPEGNVLSEKVEKFDPVKEGAELVHDSKKSNEE